MIILNHPKSSGFLKIKLENIEETKLFHLLTPYIEKAGYYWELESIGYSGQEIGDVIISSQPLKN